MIGELPEDVRDEMLELVETEGIRAAVEAMIGVCRDPKAPAAAKATAAGHLFRVSALGGFGQSSESARQKEIHEMSPEELDIACKTAVRELNARRRHDETANLQAETAGQAAGPALFE